MKRIFKIFAAFIVLLMGMSPCFAQSERLLVLPDNIQFESTNHLVYPDASVIFASDTINLLKNNNRIDIVSMREVRDTFRKNLKLQLLAKNILKEYKYNYNVSFVDLNILGKAFNTDKVLLITSTTDVQNYFLRRTIWDCLSVGGSPSVAPAYRLSTYVALVDVAKETVLWQKTYQKTISSNEDRIIAISFAPATEQLEKIKLYSEYFISPSILQMVQLKIAPPLLMQPGVQAGLQDIGNIDLQPKILEEDLVLKAKPKAPDSSKLKISPVFVNDL